MPLPHEPRWTVDIPTRTAAGGHGVHTFVVGAATGGAAVDAAWRRAHTREAARHRGGAVLAAPHQGLFARPFTQGLA